MASPNLLATIVYNENANCPTANFFAYLPDAAVEIPDREIDQLDMRSS